MRNIIERWFGVLEAKLKGFHNNFLYHASVESIGKFLNAFISIYNWVLINGLS